MATILKGLRLAHLRQLSSYIHQRGVEGWYYGNKEQFEKRHKELVEWVESAIEYVKSNAGQGNIIKNQVCGVPTKTSKKA